MAKKKNRKKELKKQQKLDIKVLSTEEAELYEFFEKKPIIVERRRIANLDDQHKAILQEFERTGVEPDYRIINQQLREERFPFSEDYALFRQAMHTPNTRKRKQMLKEVLSINPDFFAAEFHLLVADEEPYARSYFDKVYSFYLRALNLWRVEGYTDWNYFETRPILQGLMYCLEYFKAENFIGLALEVTEKIRVHASKRYPPNFLYLMLSLYNETGQFDKVEQVYHAEMRKENKDDGLLLHLLISKALQGKWQEADQLFEHLEQLNSETKLFFGDTYWLERVLEIEEEDIYVPFSEQSLKNALYPLFDFLQQNPLLEDFLTRISDDFYENHFASHFDGNLEHLKKTLKQAQAWYANLGKSEFAGIRMDLVRIFSEHHLNSSADFKKKTEKEVLSIKGIGAATIKKLKANGVVFKKDKS